MGYLQVQGLHKIHQHVSVLSDINLDVEQGRKVAIAGETGSGKTTLLKIIGGSMQPDEGVVIFKGEKVKGPDEQLIGGHPQMAYVSQHFELRNHYRVGEELDYARRMSDERADQVYRICRINHLLSRYTHALSGGERQRIAVAKALLMQPEVLLLDEPFSNLDQTHRKVMQVMVDAISDELGITILLVDHTPDHILPWADQIIVLRQGKLVQQGNPTALYRHPVDAYVAGLFGRFSLLPDAWRKAMDSPSFMVVRPEQLTFRKREATGGGIEGHIVQVRYYGAFNEVTVTIPGGELLVRIPVEESLPKRNCMVYSKI